MPVPFIRVQPVTDIFCPVTVLSNYKLRCLRYLIYVLVYSRPKFRALISEGCPLWKDAQALYLVEHL